MERANWKYKRLYALFRLVILNDLQNIKASYGKQIIDALSSRLTNEFDSGFSPGSIR